MNIVDEAYVFDVVLIAPPPHCQLECTSTYLIGEERIRERKGNVYNTSSRGGGKRGLRGQANFSTCVAISIIDLFEFSRYVSL